MNCFTHEPSKMMVGQGQKKGLTVIPKLTTSQILKASQD